MPASHPVFSAVASSPDLTWSLMALQNRLALRNRWRFKTDAPPAVTPGVWVAIDCRHRDRIAASGRFLVLLVVVDLGKFRVDDVLVLAAIAAGSSTTGAFRPAGAAFLRLLVHCL